MRYAPAIDIYEDEEKVTVWCELPGVEPTDIDVHCENGRLRVRGRAAARQEEATPWLLREYEVGDYERELDVSELIDVGRASASCADGVLTLTLPKTEKARPRRIEVKPA